MTPSLATHIPSTSLLYLLFVRYTSSTQGRKATQRHRPETALDKKALPERVSELTTTP